MMEKLSKLLERSVIYYAEFKRFTIYVRKLGSFRERRLRVLCDAMLHFFTTLIKFRT